MTNAQVVMVRRILFIYKVAKASLGVPLYLQITCINPDLLLEVFSEDVGDLDSLLQNTTVGHSLGKVRPGAGVLELLEVDVVRDIVSIPVRPAFGVDSIAQLAILEDNAGIRAPGPTQICRTLASCSCDRGLVEDIEGRAVVGFSSTGGDISGPNRLNVAAFEPRLGVAAKNEVDGAFDVAVGV